MEFMLRVSAFLRKTSARGSEPRSVCGVPPWLVPTEAGN
jgi:hypothetical protein